jgi:hypothetical protein
MAFFMRSPLEFGTIHRAHEGSTTRFALRGTPLDEYSLLASPHSANIDQPKVEQQCGGNLARLQPVRARGMEFWEQISGVMRVAEPRAPLIARFRPDTLSVKAARQQGGSNNPGKTQGE